MGSSSEVEDRLDELYRTPPDAFVARRTELARELTAAGDKAGAKEIKAAKRPTLAAWALNQLHLTVPEVVDEAVEVADLGRQMLTGAAPGDARALARRRREVVGDLAAAAKAVLQEHGDTSAAIERQVTETLDAALVSPDVAEQLVAGRLLTATTATGFEGLLSLPGGGEDAAAEGGLVDRTKRRTRKAKGEGPALRVLEGGRSDAADGGSEDADEARLAERAQLEARREEAAAIAEQAHALVEQRRAEVSVAADELEGGREEVVAAEKALRAAEARALAFEQRLDEARASLRGAEQASADADAAAEQAARDAD